jgi:hypothetical protein
MKIFNKCMFLLFALLVSALSVYSQDTTSCRVLMKEIAGTYKGDCKNGVADGKGTATGVEKYTGEFKNGLPDGKGKYTYRNGDIYSGYWTNGLKNGKGKYTYTVNGESTTVEGYWKNGDYTGISNTDEFYRVTNKTHIENYSIKKLEGDGDKISVFFERANLKTTPSDLQITVSSGDLNQGNRCITITQFAIPVHCEIHYTIKGIAGIWECYLFFDILKRGNYEVIVTNN